MARSQQEFDKNKGIADQLAGMNGYDLSTFDSRQRAVADVNTRIQTGDTLVAGLGGAGDLSDSDRTTLVTRAAEWLRQNGMQISIVEESMYGPGDYINIIKQVNKQLRDGAGALNWLHPRMTVQEGTSRQ